MVEVPLILVVRLERWLLEQNVGIHEVGPRKY